MVTSRIIRTSLRGRYKVLEDGHLAQVFDTEEEAEAFAAERDAKDRQVAEALVARAPYEEDLARVLGEPWACEARQAMHRLYAKWGWASRVLSARKISVAKSLGRVLRKKDSIVVLVSQDAAFLGQLLCTENDQSRVDSLRDQYREAEDAYYEKVAKTLEERGIPPWVYARESGPLWEQEKIEFVTEASEPA